MPLPTVIQTAAQTVFTNKVYAVWTPPGVSPTKVNMVADLVDYDGNSDIKDTLFPGDDGLLRPLRRDQTKSEESFMLKLYDLEKVKAILGGLNGFVDGGKLQLFITDPKDASGKVRMQTDDFPCSAQRDGQVKFGGQEASTATLKFVSTKTSAISFTFNGDVPA